MEIFLTILFIIYIIYLIIKSIDGHDQGGKTPHTM
jgi:hypothetical protein